MRAPAPNPSPLRGRYLVRNRPWNAFLHVTDRMLARVVRHRKASVGTPRRVLLAVGGHLGDALIATSAIAHVRRAFPGAEIGMLLGSWAKLAIEGHPDLRWIHTIDQWKMNRTGRSLVGKWMHDRASRRRALHEIRAVGYDVAIDLYVYYPNVSALLWRAGVPVRVGYTSGGYGSLYTHPVEWTDGNRHAADDHMALLRVLAPDLAGAEAPPLYHVPPVPASARERAESALREAGVSPGEYVVVHMTAGSPLREWPREKWRQLAERLTAEGHELVFTGSGALQEEAAAEVSRGLPRCTNLSGRLGWHEFVHALACAQLVICVETVAAHIAAASGTPCVALWTGITRLTQWRPLGAASTVLINPVPCAPCFRSRGCAAMSCVRDVGVETVLEAVRSQRRAVTLAGAPS